MHALHRQTNTSVQSCMHYSTWPEISDTCGASDRMEKQLSVHRHTHTHTRAHTPTEICTSPHAHSDQYTLVAWLFQRICMIINREPMRSWRGKKWCSAINITCHFAKRAPPGGQTNSAKGSTHEGKAIAHGSACLWFVQQLFFLERWMKIMKSQRSAAWLKPQRSAR